MVLSLLLICWLFHYRKPSRFPNMNRFICLFGIDKTHSLRTNIKRFISRSHIFSFSKNDLTAIKIQFKWKFVVNHSSDKNGSDCFHWVKMDLRMTWLARVDDGSLCFFLSNGFLICYVWDVMSEKRTKNSTHFHTSVFTWHEWMENNECGFGCCWIIYFWMPFPPHLG